ncbi:MAG TPA: hypothetical protein VK978_04090 [Candidatus Saccharimonadales bacterium]|nr:hypothetical protein [Candidatus Saccharimonadales bacterium]
MAVAAEYTIATELSYRLVDTIAGVAEARQSERLRAEALLESRRNALQSGSSVAELYVPVDALSTAHSVLQAEREFGEGSPEYTERYQGLVLDCRRLVGEWYRKKKPEYFEPIRHSFNTETEEFFSHGLSIRQMTENALTPITEDPEEEARRINERVEETTPHILRSLGAIALGTEKIRTISECSDTAIRSYESDVRHGHAHRGYRGYVPEIQKLMIRDIRLDTQTQDRFQEQIGLPGTYITHYVIQKALEERGAAVGYMDKTQLHGSQILAGDDLMEFVALLDTTASREWCTNVFMGEEVPDDYMKDYSGFRREALQRQEELKDMAETVTVFVLDLAATNYDRRQAPAHVENFVKKLLLDLGKKDMAVAEQMFDEQTARGLQEVVYLESIGQLREAYDRMQDIEKAAPGGGSCGAGSCGLEGIDTNSEAGKELAGKVRASSGDTVLRDKERACKCGSKSIVYAYNRRKVNKYCESCGAFESKATSAVTKQTDYAKAA